MVMTAPVSRSETRRDIGITLRVCAILALPIGIGQCDAWVEAQVKIGGWMMVVRPVYLKGMAGQGQSLTEFVPGLLHDYQRRLFEICSLFSEGLCGK
jgi:hypothetical protein